MVTARIAGLSPGTSPPPVTIPITPFLALMRPPSCFPFLRYIRRSARYHYTRHRDFADVFCFGDRPNPTPTAGAVARPLYLGVHFRSGFLIFRCFLPYPLFDRGFFPDSLLGCLLAHPLATA